MPLGWQPCSDSYLLSLYMQVALCQLLAKQVTSLFRSPCVGKWLATLFSALGTYFPYSPLLRFSENTKSTSYISSQWTFKVLQFCFICLTLPPLLKDLNCHHLEVRDRGCIQTRSWWGWALMMNWHRAPKPRHLSRLRHQRRLWRFLLLSATCGRLTWDAAIQKWSLLSRDVGCRW